MSDEILDMAGGNNRLAHALVESLRILADGGSEKLRELACAVLGGASLRDLALSEAYGEEIGAAFDCFWNRYTSMTGEERVELEDIARQRYYVPS